MVLERRGGRLTILLEQVADVKRRLSAQVWSKVAKAMTKPLPRDRGNRRMTSVKAGVRATQSDVLQREVSE